MFIISDFITIFYHVFFFFTGNIFLECSNNILQIRKKTCNIKIGAKILTKKEDNGKNRGK